MAAVVADVPFLLGLQVGRKAVGVGTGQHFDNFGTLVKTGGLSTIATAFSNAGSVAVNSGTLQLNNFGTNAGTLTVAGGSTLSTNANPLLNNGLIGGVGTVNLGGAGTLLTNAGTLTPGFSPGALTINGDLTMTGASVTSIEIQSPGLSAGTDYDRLAVTGAATLAGTLNVTHLAGFNPNVGASFTPITYASRTGDFTTKNFPVGYSYTTTPNATNYVLGVGALSNTWIGTTGAWETIANWSLNHVPTATEDVLIPDVGGAGVNQTITVSTAGQLAKSITNAEILSLPSGSLTFTNASTSTGSVLISGGTLTANGSLAAGTLSMSSGVLNGTGAVSITAAGSNWTGGTMSGSGTTTIS